MRLIKATGALALTGVIVLTMAGCRQSAGTTPPSQDTTRPAGWTEATHGSKASPNYEIVFPQERVNRIKITITPEDWQAMQTNMTELFGRKGTGQPGGMPGPGALPGGAAMSAQNPLFVPADIEFNSLIWTNVGVRYKGNSSLRSAWNSGTLKLPLKLDFDQFEDEYPEINNQRFYGFKQLSFSNAFKDGTYMRDAITSDILTEAGLAAAETAYYEVIMDYGQGEVNLGLYVMIEVVDDTVIDRVFGSDSGNIYQGDGAGTSLAKGTYARIQESFQKENNEQKADWSDIEALYNILHSGERTADPAAWRKSLESIFDVDVFLEWLAIGSIIQHWDAYGAMSHNFYLYNNPETGKLTWISWDHNEVLGVTGGPGGGAREGRQAGLGARSNVSLSRDEVGQNWPLIRYLLDDPVYHARYDGFLRETINSVFKPATLEKKCRVLAALITPYAVPGSGGATFASAVEELIKNINERYQATVSYLGEGR
jgi:spore coat protein H